MRKARRAASRRGRKLRIMFADEARFGRINRPRPCWAPIGTRPEVAAQLIRETGAAFADYMDAEFRDLRCSRIEVDVADGGFLDGQYTVWGEVVKGMECVDKIARGEPPAKPDKIVSMKVMKDIK